MKKILFILTIILITSCSYKTKEVLVLNKRINNARIYQNKGYYHYIYLDIQKHKIIKQGAVQMDWNIGDTVTIFQARF